jgi:hypothetical protein
MTQLSLFTHRPEPAEREMTEAGRDQLRRSMRIDLRMARNATFMPWPDDEVPRIEEKFARYCRHLPPEEAAQFLDSLREELERLRQPRAKRAAG